MEGAGWAARTGSQLSINTHGPLGFASLSAPTLGAAPDYVEVLEDIYLAHCVFDAPQTAIAIPAA